MKTKKHNHTLTNFLKVFVFSLMILMPFIIFIPNAFYYGFNEQAVAQEKTEQVPVYYETNEVDSVGDIVYGNIYTLTIDTNARYSQFFKVGIGDYYFIQGGLEYTVGSTSLPVPTLERYTSNSSKMYLFETYTRSYSTTDTFIMDVVILNNYGYIDILIPYLSKCTRQYVKEYQPLTTNMSITDSMSYAWESTWQNELFSWTGNTAIYNGINATTSGIGISENSYIANYLAYIFLLTVIYVIVDIILGVFTMLTHLFNKEPK